jgi:N-acetylglucosamine kinase-like BadF-type ATPase
MLGIPEGPRLIIANDTHLLAAPLRLHPDISTALAVIAGTGSICVSFKAREDGKLEELGRVGGWGWILGDEGGGFHVGREAIRQILSETDRASIKINPPPIGKSTLKSKVFELFGVRDALEILSIIHLPDPLPGAAFEENTLPYVRMTREKRLSSLCPIVFASALNDADPLALNILHTCATLLADQITILLRPVGEPGDLAVKAINAKESIICFGGSLSGVDAYRKMVLDELLKRGQVFRYVQLVDDPAATGAASLVSGHRYA